jgi:hypothetical protein
MPVRAAGALLIAGSLIFLTGAALGVPSVFTEPDAERRLRLLEHNLGRWRAAQPLYALGPAIAAVAVGRLAAVAPVAGGTEAMLWLAAIVLFAGSLAWARSVRARAVRVADFALGRLPGWPFAAYVLLTIGGLAALGVGLLAGGAAWLGAATLVADVLFLVAYGTFGDIPPFAFYILLLAVGTVLVANPDAVGS